MSKSDMAGTYLGLAMISNMLLLNYNISEFTSWSQLFASIAAIVSLSMFYIFHYRKEEDK